MEHAHFSWNCTHEKGTPPGCTILRGKIQQTLTSVLYCTCLLDVSVDVVHQVRRYRDHQTYVLWVRSHYVSQECCHELPAISVEVRLTKREKNGW